MSKKEHPFTSNSIGAKTLWDLADNGKGAILISAHLGNWEIAGHFLKKLSVPINIVLFDGEHQQIKEMLDNVMKEKRFKIIAIRDDFSHLIEINKALKAKEFICIHGDRYSDHAKAKTMKMNFLGKEAIFPLGPFSLVSRLKVPHAFVFALKVKKYHYEFIAFEGNGTENTVQEVLQAYVNRLEIMVKKYPTQWFNFYKFWEEKEEIKKLG
jgi:predicted LPLAT superfamily acyltransferase